VAGKESAPHIVISWVYFFASFRFVSRKETGGRRRSRCGACRVIGGESGKTESEKWRSTLDAGSLFGDG